MDRQGGTTVEELVTTFAATLTVMESVDVVVSAIPFLTPDSQQSVFHAACDGSLEDLIATAQQLSQLFTK